MDNSKALIIVEKGCYISRINISYGNPSLDPSRPDLPQLDCIAAGRRLPCSLCLLRLGQSASTFSPLESSFPVLTPPKPVIASKSLVKKKDKLNKKERIIAEKHLVEFGESIRQLERCSDGHKYRPRSSYFPLDVSSAILDMLLVIHFPSHLDDILKETWIYFGTHRMSLYNSIIDIQTRIKAGRTKAPRLTKSRQRQTQPLEMDTENEESASETSTESEEPAPQSSGNKRRAMEDITNTAKRRRAPRAPQPSVAQAQQEYGPRYQARRRGAITQGSSGVDGQENNTRTMNLRSRNRLN